MQIADYVAKITGKSLSELFFLGNPLVILEQDENGEISVSHWDESLSVSKPTDEEIASALSAPDLIAVPSSVSARQFKLQLLSQDILDDVDAWVETQSKAVQIAFEYSSEFVRSEPMMASGFKAMKFTDSQIDDFFVAASKL